MTGNIYKEITEAVNSLRSEMTTRFDNIDQKFEKLDCKYVRKEDFAPIKAILFGMIGLILIAFMGAIISLIIDKDPAASAKTASDIIQVTPVVRYIGATLFNN